MSVFSSLTNRIFIASAVLVLGSIVVPVYFVNVAVTERANAELRSGLNEAALLVNDYVTERFENFLQVARTVADLPKLQAAAETDDPPTVKPIAQDYERRIQADLFVVTGKTGRVLASVGSVAPDPEVLADMLGTHLTSRETAWFWPYPGGVLRLAAIPLFISPGPERLGTLVVGVTLDQTTRRIKALTDSDLVIISDGRVVASTLDAARSASLGAMASTSGIFEQRLGQEDYIGRVQPLGSSSDPIALVLRSRTERLAFLQQLHRQIAITGIAAVLVATLLGYAIARTVTRPLRAVTETMREMAATGDLARTVPTVRAWDDEDARLLATTFRQLTTALDRFQREVTQRERLSSLGRLSTVIAHEVRNPLMIIKTALRSLRRHVSPDVVEVADSIDEEVNRINHVVTDVLDFARPIRFSLQSADLVQICREAAQAVTTGAEDIRVAVEASESQAPVVTDSERLRGVLVNVLTNAQHAVRAKGANGQAEPSIRVRTNRAAGRRWQIEVRDLGVGIAPADLPRVFEPFFTTRRTGSGLGLALARNVIEGLGGSIAVESQVDAGTTVRIDLPETSRLSSRPL
jgi:signal transduction histidine kinase